MEEYKWGYSWNVQTGEFMSKEAVWLEKATGKYPCASNVTFKRPPATGDRETAVWNRAKGDWDKVADLRGMPWWNPDGTFGGIIESLHETGKITTRPPELKDHECVTWNKDRWEIKPAEGWVTDRLTGEIRAMTQVERIIAGVEQLPDTMKIENGELIAKTMDELYDEGKITLEEYNENARQEREAEYKRTTDKIGLMVLRGEATKEEWENAILAVKAKWPYREA